MAYKLNIKQIDYLNIFLIVLSFLLAVLFPFELFIIVYAFLGPLHYLTEIRWLHHKDYFSGTKSLIWIFSIFAFVFSIPFIIQLPFFESSTIKSGLNIIATYTNNFVFFALIFSIALVLIKKRKYQILFIVVGIIIAVISHSSVSNNLLIGSLLSTIVHVYIFTLLFMLYGALKSKSYPGLFASALVLLVPLVIFKMEMLPANYVIAEWSKTIFTANNFHFLNLNLTRIFGIGDGTAFYFYDKPFLKIQIFLAFGYTYHYLNWFSKTSIIGWHKMLSNRNSIVVAIAWIVSVLLYAIDYRTGFILLVFLSTLHVFLEFPLNIISIKGIGEEIKKRL